MVDLLNRDTKKNGTSGGAMDITNKKSAGSNGRGKWCLLHKGKPYGDVEYIKSIERTELAQTNT